MEKSNLRLEDKEESNKTNPYETDFVILSAYEITYLTKSSGLKGKDFDQILSVLLFYFCYKRF